MPLFAISLCRGEAGELLYIGNFRYYEITHYIYMSALRIANLFRM